MTLQRAFWVVFGVGFVIYLAMVLWSLPLIQADAGGLMPFDLRLQGYSTAEAQAFLNALGAEGKAQYLGAQRLLDLFYPALSALSLILAYLLLFARKWAIVFSWIAALAAFFDWGENALVQRILQQEVATLDAQLVQQASTLTQLKSLFVSIAVLLLLWGMIRAGIRRWKK